MNLLNRLTKSIALPLLFCTLLACQSETTSAQGPDSSTYTVLPEPTKVSTGDKIEVTELFWYGCGHCFSLEPHIKTWLESGKPDNAEFVKVPAVFSARWEFHAKAFYTMQALGVLDKANEGFFARIHVARKPINSIGQFTEFLAQYDLSATQVEDAFKSFAVDNNFRNAKRITLASQARGVPAILVDGKYLTSVQQAGGTAQLFDTVNKLVKKAAAER